jgi:phosphomannomutase
MIHTYKMNGYNIVLDVNSGSIHVTDDITYEILNAFDTMPTKEQVLSLFKGRNTEDRLTDVWQEIKELQKRFGYFGEKLMNIVLEGYEGQRIINATMEKWRTSYPAEMNGSKLVYKVDYKTGIKETIADGKTEKVDVDYSDVLKYKFDNGCWYAIRPSGTEPKLKVYLYSKGTSKQNAQDNIEALERIITQELIEAGAIRKER